jgi:hypothetical protein
LESGIAMPVINIFVDNCVDNYIENFWEEIDISVS